MSCNQEANIRCLVSYASPQLWSQLAATNALDRRHCKECNRDVYLVRDEEDFFQHAAHGHCVAVPTMPEASRWAGPFTGSPRQR